MNRRDTVGPVVAELFKLALGLAPKGSRVWVKDMRSEAPFIEPYAARLGWAFGALLSALRFRMAALPGGRGPRTFVFSAAVMALLAIAVVPKSWVARTPAPGLERPAVSADNQAEPRARREALAEELASSQASRAEARPKEAVAGAEARDAALFSERRADEVDAWSDAEGAAPPALALEASGVTGALSVPALTALSLSSAAITRIDGAPVTLNVHAPTRLELYEGPAGGRRLVAKQQVQAGDSFGLNTSFYVVAENAGALSLSLGTRPLGLLGPKGVSLARRFDLP